jgi:hypothetical protein
MKIQNWLTGNIEDVVIPDGYYWANGMGQIIGQDDLILTCIGPMRFRPAQDYADLADDHNFKPVSDFKMVLKLIDKHD